MPPISKDKLDTDGNELISGCVYRADRDYLYLAMEQCDGEMSIAMLTTSSKKFIRGVVSKPRNKNTLEFVADLSTLMRKVELALLEKLDEEKPF